MQASKIISCVYFVHYLVFGCDKACERWLRHYVQKLIARYTLDIFSELESGDNFVAFVIPKQYAVACVVRATFSARNEQNEVCDSDHLYCTKSV